MWLLGIGLRRNLRYRSCDGRLYATFETFSVAICLFSLCLAKRWRSWSVIEGAVWKCFEDVGMLLAILTHGYVSSWEWIRGIWNGAIAL